ncbi:MAG: DNA polymerase III subunit beta [Patescibacteria group bacterium]
MKFEVLQSSFSKILGYSLKFVSSRAQLPILANFYIEASKNSILIQSTNLEISFSSHLGAKVDQEGKITVPARTLFDIISNLPNETIAISSEKEQLKIISQGFQGSLAALDSTDFPPVPSSLGKEGIKLPKDKFLEALSLTLFAVSQDETRPALTGVLFIFRQKEVVLVATDGFRLSQKKFLLSGNRPERKFILPKGILTELTRLSDLEEEAIDLEFNGADNQVVFGIGSTILTSRIIGGEFPNFEKIIPSTTTSKILVDKEEMARAVKLASVFARDSANIVKLKAAKGALGINAESAKSGTEETKVEIKHEGEEVEVSYNYRFLEEFLNNAKGDEIEMNFSGSSSPGVFKDTDDKDFLHLIMPVKIQG